MRWLVVALVMVGCGGRAARDEAKVEGDGGSAFRDPPAVSSEGGVFIELPDATVGADAVGPWAPLPPDPVDLSNESVVWFTLVKPPGSVCRDSGEFVRSSTLTPPLMALSSSCKVSPESFYGRMTQPETELTSAELIEIEGNERSAKLKLVIRSLPLAQDDCSVSEFQRGADWFSANFECSRLDEPSLPNRCAASGNVRFVGCEVPSGDQ